MASKSRMFPRLREASATTKYDASCLSGRTMRVVSVFGANAPSAAAIARRTLRCSCTVDTDY